MAIARRVSCCAANPTPLRATSATLNMSTTAIVVLAALLGMNVVMMFQVRRSAAKRSLQNMLITLLWVVPFLGIGLVQLYLAATMPEPSTDQSKSDEVTDPAPATITVAGLAPFDVLAHLHTENNFPMLDWTAVDAWLQGGSGDVVAQGKHLARRAWLLHLAHAYEPKLRLYENEQAFVLSPFDAVTARATARYIGTTRRRIQTMLSDVAAFPPGEKSILLLMPDETDYYHYIACFYPDSGEFATSSGMFIDVGCPHFVVQLDVLEKIEPVIAHEMTHSAVRHLQLPRWVDEGLAVNTEQALTGVPRLIYTAQEIHQKHVTFWNAETIQEFWSGRSFFRTDDGNLLSYELARILVKHMSRDWENFARFLATSERTDGGARAAAEAMNVCLGALACAVLEQAPEDAWVPRDSADKAALAARPWRDRFSPCKARP